MGSLAAALHDPGKPGSSSACQLHAAHSSGPWCCSMLEPEVLAAAEAHLQRLLAQQPPQPPAFPAALLGGRLPGRYSPPRSPTPRPVHLPPSTSPQPPQQPPPLPAPAPQRPQAGAPTRGPPAAGPHQGAQAAASPVPLPLDLLRQHLPPAPSHAPPPPPAPRVPSWSDPPPPPTFSSPPHPVPLPLPRKAATVSSPSQPWPSAALPPARGRQHAALPAPSRPQPRRPQPVLGAFDGGGQQELQPRWPQDVGGLPQWLPQPTFQPQVLALCLLCARPASLQGPGWLRLAAPALMLLPCSCSAVCCVEGTLTWLPQHSFMHTPAGSHAGSLQKLLPALAGVQLVSHCQVSWQGCVHCVTCSRLWLHICVRSHVHRRSNKEQALVGVQGSDRPHSKAPVAPSWGFLEQMMHQPCANVAAHLQPSKAGQYSLFGQPCDTGYSNG